MRNYSYIHTDIFSYYAHQLKYQKNLNINKTLSLMLDDVSKISKNKFIIPTYNYSFPKTKKYDVLNDKSEVGFFSEYFRKLYKKNRTSMPIFSDCSSKKISDFKITLNPFDSGSIFDLLNRNKGKIISFGSDFAPSYIMYIEKCIPGGPRYRYLKRFKGEVLKGKIRKKIEIDFFCRPLNIYFKYDLKKIKKDLMKENLLTINSTDQDFKYSSISAKEFKDFSMYKLKKNHFYFLNKKTQFLIKKYIKKKDKINVRDFEYYE